MKARKITALLLAALMLTATCTAANETDTQALNEVQEAKDMEEQMNNSEIQEIKPLNPQPVGEGMDAEAFLMESTTGEKLTAFTGGDLETDRV